jgi:hypothetical protein
MTQEFIWILTIITSYLLIQFWLFWTSSVRRPCPLLVIWPFTVCKRSLSLSLSLMLRPMISRPVCLGIKHPSGAYDQILLLSDSCWFVDVGRSSWREDVSVVCSWYWFSPALLFSGASPLGLANIFHCLRFETFLFVAYYDSQGYGGGIRPRLQKGSVSHSLKRIFRRLEREHLLDGMRLFVNKNNSVASQRLFVATRRIVCLCMRCRVSVFGTQTVIEENWLPSRF